MKLFIPICLILNSLLGYSQIYVGNNAYIFVNDNVLFSNDYVQLNGTNSNLYLRNDAQFIQGNGVTGNSGLGELSVQQNGTVNGYAYNYWCSPVGNNSPSFGNEHARVSLIDESTGLISSINVAFTSNYNSSTAPLTISNRWLYTFETSNAYSDWYYVGANGAIAPGLGFTMKGVGNGTFGNQLYDFRGKPNNGTIINNVAPPVGGVEQLTLVGNPYPSALDARDFIHDSQNAASITGSLYYWEQQPGQTSHYIADYVGGYATYTINAAGTLESFVKATFLTYLPDGSTSSMPGTTSPTTKQARRYIPVGQGFMVEGVANATVRTTNSMRDYYKQSDLESEFFRMQAAHQSNNHSTEYSSEMDMTIPDDYKRLRVYVDFNDIYSRELLLNFHDSATEGFDYGLEAKSPLGVSSDAFWISNDTPYVIQAHAYHDELKIPLIIKLNEQKYLRFRIHNVQNFGSSQPIYLHDIQEDIYIDLKTQDYHVDLSQGHYYNRFEITFSNGATLTHNDAESYELEIFQNNTTSQLTILNPNILNVKTVSLFDVTGKIILNFNELSAQSNYSFPTKNLSEGVYIVNVSLDNSNTISKKVIVKD